MEVLPLHHPWLVTTQVSSPLSLPSWSLYLQLLLISRGGQTLYIHMKIHTLMWLYLWKGTTLCVFENACFKNTYFHNLQCEISEVGVAYLKATNLHTSKKVEEKHARLAKFKSCLHHCHLQCTVDVPKSYLFSIRWDNGWGQMMAHWRGCMGSQVQSDLCALVHNA